ncbi:hypothetical protein [Streptomyces sp. UG1]|uniref:hypothetical protein n=1 Tax=Streptomyces sp. UG1 TaxID=3417652 RepID=UPI003CF9A82C
MSEWLVAVLAALIGAGAALAGSVISARSTRAAGERQAEAALHTLRLTVEEQRATRVHDQRRQAYVRFLEAADAGARAGRAWEGQPTDRLDLERAYTVVLLEGPAEPAAAAGALMRCLRAQRVVLDEFDARREEFLAVARAALSRG